MACRTVPFLMTLSGRQCHSPTYGRSFKVRFRVQLCSGFQDFNRLNSSRGHCNSWALSTYLYVFVVDDDNWRTASGKLCRILLSRLLPHYWDLHVTRYCWVSDRSVASCYASSWKRYSVTVIYFSIYLCTCVLTSINKRTWMNDLSPISLIYNADDVV